MKTAILFCLVLCNLHPGRTYTSNEELATEIQKLKVNWDIYEKETKHCHFRFIFFQEQTNFLEQKNQELQEEIYALKVSYHQGYVNGCSSINHLFSGTDD